MNFCLLTIYNVTTLYYKIHPLPAKKNNKKLPRISEFVNLLSIDWSFSTVALRVVRRQQFMTILSASAAKACTAVLHLDELNDEFDQFLHELPLPFRSKTAPRDLCYRHLENFSLLS